MKQRPLIRLLRRALLTAAALAAAAASAQELNPARRHPSAAADVGDSQQVLVRFKAGAADKGRAHTLSATAFGEQAASLAARSGVALRQARRLTAALQVLEVEPLAGETLAARLERLRADPSVEYAEPDLRRYPHAFPNDPLYSGQWYLQGRADAPAAIDAEHAWDTTLGSKGVVIAVLDTGVLYNHPDLKRAAAGGRLLPGYDFVAQTATANDGDGRDANPTDPGDWVTQAETSSGPFAGCDRSGSSWHGTRVAGIIAARTNNSEGVAGITWNPWILPVRVLGKCGGRDSDIIAGMLWAAGIHVDGVPDNPYPAKIENLSLGSSGSSGCPRAYQDVIEQVSARGTLVVVSAGNEGGPVDTPANCAGAAAIAGLRHAGTKVGYSSLGPQVALSAPAGNCVNTGSGQPCLFSIDTTHNAGQTTVGAFDYTNQLNANFGTSFSAPIVAGIAGLMVSVNGNLSANQLIARLREGAVKPFPLPDSTAVPSIPQCHVPAGSGDVQNTECGCTTAVCGAGMANAPGAVAAALRPIAAVAAPAQVSPGQNVTLSAAGSAGACGRTIASYAWSSGAGVSSPTGTATTVVAPGSGSVTVQLVVTDDAGRTDSVDVTVTPNAVTTSAPANAGAHACLADIPAPPAVAVSVSPPASSVAAGGTATSFVATVLNAQDRSVVWQVNGAAGGNASVGTIDALGTYTPPASVPSPDTVTITAVSNEDTSASGSAEITLTAPAAVPQSGGGGGGGGGGGAGLDLLLGCAALLLARRRARA